MSAQQCNHRPACVHAFISCLCTAASSALIRREEVHRVDPLATDTLEHLRPKSARLVCVPGATTNGEYVSAGSCVSICPLSPCTAQRRSQNCTTTRNVGVGHPGGLLSPDRSKPPCRLPGPAAFTHHPSFLPLSTPASYADGVSACVLLPDDKHQRASLPGVCALLRWER